MKKVLPVIPADVNTLFGVAELEMHDQIGTYEALAEDRGLIDLIAEVKRLHGNIHFLFYAGASKCAEVMMEFVSRIEELLSFDILPA